MKPTITKEKILEILETEKECVQRASMPFGCTRECDKCDLVRPNDEIIAAYDAMIEIVKGNL